jgi:hypothetical protein
VASGHACQPTTAVVTAVTPYCTSSATIIVDAA